MTIAKARQKNPNKKYFGAYVKYREMVKNRVCSKIDTREIKVYYSMWLGKFTVIHMSHRNNCEFASTLHPQSGS